MSVASDILRQVRVALESAAASKDGGQADVQRCCDVMMLLRDAPITATLLQETDAGKQIRKLSKHDNTSIKAGAAKVIDTWKETIRKQAKDMAPSKAATSSKASAPAPSSPQASAPAHPPTTDADSPPQAPRAKRAPFAKTRPIGDKARDHVRASFAESLLLAVVDDEEDVDNPFEVAAALEDAVWRSFKMQVSKEYKGKVRMLLFNLKDPKNPDLRRKALIGELQPKEMVTMTSEELASDDKKHENQEIRKNMLKETERGIAQVATTDMFRCGKCKQRKCTYYQMQTRSADEPMTTFVRCTVCTNRWKFC